MSSSTASLEKPPLSLSLEAIDDLIYDARSGDLDALKSDIESLRSQHNNCSAAEIIASAIDAEPETEGGSGACLLHFPAANGNIGASQVNPLYPTTLELNHSTVNTNPAYRSIEMSRHSHLPITDSHVYYTSTIPISDPGRDQPSESLREHAVALGGVEYTSRMCESPRACWGGCVDQERCGS